MSEGTGLTAAVLERILDAKLAGVQGILAAQMGAQSTETKRLADALVVQNGHVRGLCLWQSEAKGKIEQALLVSQEAKAVAGTALQLVYEVKKQPPPEKGDKEIGELSPEEAQILKESLPAAVWKRHLISFILGVAIGMGLLFVIGYEKLLAVLK
jgi:hypothetical protein